MNFTQKLLLVVSAFGIASNIAHGQVNSLVFEFEADSVANFRQNPATVDFEGGVFSVNIRDGAFDWASPVCEDPAFFFGIGRCAPGSTGFVSRGLQNDPELDGVGPYFTITQLSAAQILRPFDPLSARLVAAPPSLLPRPLLGFEDRSLSVFFDLFTQFIRQYPISSYDFDREYLAGERARFDGEVVPGTYRYNFGSIRSTATYTAPPVVLELNQFPMLDGYRKINNQKQGFIFTNVTYDDGFAVLDPFAINTLSWSGNTVNFISPGLDVAYLSIKRLTNPGDPLSDPDLDSLPLFPSFVGNPTLGRVLLPNPLDTSFILPPNFVQPGQTGLIDLEFIIYRPTSALVYERATRRFRMPVKVTDPFDGFILSKLPPGTSSQQLAADADFDADGITNFQEWVFGSDPSKTASVPASPTVKIKTLGSTDGGGDGIDDGSPPLLFAGSDASSDGALEYSVPKLTNPVPKLKYAIEYSTDMVTWTEITSSNTDWILSDTYDEIKVTAAGAAPKTGGFFRTKVRTVN